MRHRRVAPALIVQRRLLVRVRYLYIPRAHTDRAGFIEQPMQNLTAAYTNGAASPEYNSGLMLYLITWGLIVCVRSLKWTR